MGGADSLRQAKNRLRRSIRQSRHERRNDSARDRTRVADARRIAEHALDIEEIRNACAAGAAIACYVSRPDEPPTEELRARLLEAGAVLLLPRIAGDDLVWIQQSPHTTWVTNKWGIEEPAGPAFDGQPAVWLIPGLAVDADGYRLGQGRGYFDRALQNVHDDVPIIAIVFENEVVESVPREEHDHRVDIVITPERVRWLSMPD